MVSTTSLPGQTTGQPASRPYLGWLFSDALHVFGSDRLLPQCALCESLMQPCDYPSGPQKPGPKIGSIRRNRRRPNEAREPTQTSLPSGRNTGTIEPTGTTVSTASAPDTTAPQRRQQLRQRPARSHRHSLDQDAAPRPGVGLASRLVEEHDGDSRDDHDNTPDYQPRGPRARGGLKRTHTQYSDIVQAEDERSDPDAASDPSSSSLDINAISFILHPAHEASDTPPTDNHSPHSVNNSGREGLGPKGASSQQNSPLIDGACEALGVNRTLLAQL